MGQVVVENRFSDPQFNLHSSGMWEQKIFLPLYHPVYFKAFNLAHQQTCGGNSTTGQQPSGMLLGRACYTPFITDEIGLH